MQSPIKPLSPRAIRPARIIWWLGLAGLLVVGGCASHIRSSSPLAEIRRSESRLIPEPEAARRTLLERCPIGSDREMVRKFIADHFTKVGEKHEGVITCIINEQFVPLVGHVWMEVDFTFDQGGRLRDVTVEKRSSLGYTA